MKDLIHRTSDLKADGIKKRILRIVNHYGKIGPVRLVELVMKETRISENTVYKYINQMKVERDLFNLEEHDGTEWIFAQESLLTSEKNVRLFFETLHTQYQKDFELLKVNYAELSSMNRAMAVRSLVEVLEAYHNQALFTSRNWNDKAILRIARNIFRLKAELFGYIDTLDGPNSEVFTILPGIWSKDLNRRWRDFNIAVFGTAGRTERLRN